MNHNLICDNVYKGLEQIPEQSVHSIITSPPYYQLRDYDFQDQIGLEKTPEEYIAKLVDVFSATKRVLRNDGTVWLNIGDTYARNSSEGYKKGDLLGIPWMLAFALRKDGWFLRSDIIWAKCLGANVYLYAKTKNGESVIQVREIERLFSSGVQLWNGKKWTDVVGIKRNISEERIKIELRSGEKIICTPNHRWPVKNGDIVETSQLKIGDILCSSNLPDCENKFDGLDDEEIGWFIGMYLAEGSKGKENKVLQFSGHCKEVERFERLKKIAKKYHGTCSRHKISDNGITDNIYGNILVAIIDTYLDGSCVTDKRLTSKCWKRSNIFLKSLLKGYLEGDGHYDIENDRWRLGFAYNEYLERDLRVICSRLGVKLKLKPSYSINTTNGNKYRTFRGEIRFDESKYFNAKNSNEIVSISKIKAGNVFDISVRDEPHLFCLASGILSHNSNPLPGGVTDRPVSSHEYLFLLGKSENYYYDQESIKENAVERNADGSFKRRIKRDVWTVPVASFKGAHFAVFPQGLVEPCVLASTSSHGCCKTCGSPYERQVQKTRYSTRPGIHNKVDKKGFANRDSGRHLTDTKTVGWSKTCSCETNEIEKSVVLDIFCGSGTTGVVALRNGRKFIGIDGKQEYLNMAKNRLIREEEVIGVLNASQGLQE